MYGKMIRDLEQRLDGELGHAETRETLWITDAELIRRIGVPEKIARDALRMLDHDPRRGFPQKQAFWGDRRYWPDVKAWFDAVYGHKMRVPQGRNGHD